MNIDDATIASAELSDALRQWLRARGESDFVQAGALAYEIAALIARHAASLPHAVQLVDVWAEMMKMQIADLGVGVEHP